MAKRNPYPGVYPLPGGGFRYMVREPQPDGSERQRWYSLNAAGERYASRKEAHDARIAHLARIASPSLEWSKDSLGAYLETWQKGRRKWGDSSRGTYASMIRVRILPYLGIIPLRELSALHIEAWHGELAPRYAPSTINQTHFILAAALKRAVELELIPRNPASLVTPPPIAVSIPGPWLPEQVRGFLAVSDQHRNAAVYRLLLTTGMRVGELLSLRWSDLDWRGAQVAIQRTLTRDAQGRRVIGTKPKRESSRRTIPLTQLTLDLLRQHQERQKFIRRSAGDTWQDNDLIVCSRRGTRLDPSTIPDEFRRLLATATDDEGKPLPRIRAHDLRHTAATLMLVSGTPVHVVARILGHGDATTTLRMYAHYLPAYGRDAVADLERMFVSTVPVSPAQQTQ